MSTSSFIDRPWMFENYFCWASRDTNETNGDVKAMITIVPVLDQHPPSYLKRQIIESKRKNIFHTCLGHYNRLLHQLYHLFVGLIFRILWNLVISKIKSVSNQLLKFEKTKLGSNRIVIKQIIVNLKKIVDSTDCLYLYVVVPLPSTSSAEW